MKQNLIYTVMTLILMVALLWLPPIAGARPDPPPIAPSCYIAVLTVVIGTVVVINLYHLCQYANQQNQDDLPDIPPEVSTNLPAPGAPFQVLPPLHLQQQLFGKPIVGQHQDTGLTFRTGTNWITDFTFTNDVRLCTNIVVTPSGNWVILPPIIVTNSPSDARLFRLVGQQ